ncbi:hypothetical protein V1512DRAFT_246407 [Lipomyces arxii]|uniref:uncharacterized protein n=1 Tax=Lipomyces arxii TaxID=56418 RepID=UPI0034CD53A6
MYARSGLIEAGSDSATPQQQYARGQTQTPVQLSQASQQLPNGPQKLARQQPYPLKAQKSTPTVIQQSYPYSSGQSHFPQPTNAQKPAQPPPAQRRTLSSNYTHITSLPGTPPVAAPSSPAKGLLSTASRVDDNASKIYYMTPPSDLLPLIKDNFEAGYPDFFPWNGSHPEDLLTESYIQHGFEDKPFLPNETGSARHALLTVLRQTTSLSSLSNFMMTSINKRHEFSRLMPPTTFKPPPRVTLTDHKREAWLKDLATPSVPLRRLSRTIPHGLRNKILVEQCCNKRVPIHRAVWFARCVGANELRGLRRKGSNASTAVAEAQWVREWTIQVASFLEKLISECGQPQDPAQKNSDGLGWRYRMDYGIRFASHLYFEDLIDRSFFLDWTIVQLEKSSFERIPVALLLIRLFWTKITSQPSKSQKLGQVLLNHIKSIWDVMTAEKQKSSNEVYLQLLSKLASCVWDLQSQSSEAFIVPDKWSSMRSILQKAIACVNVPKELADKAFEMIALDNMTLAHQNSLLSASGKSTEEDQQERLIVVLRNANVPYDVGEISDELLLTVSMPSLKYDNSDYYRLVRVLFQWSICEGNDQASRAELATSVLMRWTSLGKPVFDALFQLFDEFLQIPNVEIKLFQHFLSQLLEKKVFTADTYIRRVISRGIFLLPDQQDKIRCHRFILAHLCLDDYADAIRIQRDVLLKNMPSEVIVTIDSLNEFNEVEEDN